MPKPEKLRLRPHHLEFIRYLATVATLRMDIYEGIPREKDKNVFGSNKKVVEELAANLTNWKDVPVEWVDGADSICELCVKFDNKKRQCNGFYHFEGPEERIYSPEELRKKADHGVLKIYDITNAKTIGDILVLKMRPPY